MDDVPGRRTRTLRPRLRQRRERPRRGRRGADGVARPTYRIWAPLDMPGCTPAGTAPCRRSSLGREIVGGFDFNGDGREDLAAGRSAGLDLFLGRPPDDATSAKLTMVCDPS